MTQQHPVPLGGGPHVTGQWRSVLAPYDGRDLGEVPVCGLEDVQEAVALAAALHRGGALPAWQRAEVLDRAARAMVTHREELARLVALEAAKPIRTARGEVDRAASTFTFSATAARTLTGEVVPLEAAPSGGGKLAFTLRVPVGVVAAITPFNFPLNLVAHKVGPAIAAGCPVIVKPASATPLTSIRLAEILLSECGLPDGWVQVVTGPGGEIGDALVDHPDVTMITFTGSPPVGWAIRARAPRKRVSLELGNNAPVVIEADADWRAAAAAIRTAGFSHAGQSCISTQRIYVHEHVIDDFTAALVDGVSTLVVGDPLDEATEVSSLITTGDRDRVASWIHEATGAGAKLAVGGEVHGTLLTPAVVTGLAPDMKLASHEVFGPVVGVAGYESFDEALALANATDFGLQAAVYTRDLSKAMRAARTLDFGGVLVNEVPTWRADNMPYGGLRDSGNTREGPAYAVDEMTESRLIVLPF